MAKYGKAFQQWKAWAECHVEVSVFPVSQGHFALHLQHLSESTHSLSAIWEAVNSIGWVNQLSGREPSEVQDQERACQGEYAVHSSAQQGSATIA